MDEKVDLVKKIIEKKKGVLLSENYDLKKIPIKCEKGHPFFISFNSLKYGVWCNFCVILSNREKKKIEKNQFTKEYYAQRLKEIIESKNGKLLTDYTKSSNKVKVECENGHQWFGLPPNIINGWWCPRCAKRRIGKYRNPKCFEIEIEKLLKEKEAQLVEEYKHSNKSIMVRCKFGHDCLASILFIRKGWYCQICNSKSNEMKDSAALNKEQIIITQKKIETLLNPFGTKLLSDFKNHYEKITVECKNGHRRELLVRSLYQNPECSVCRSIKQIEERIRALLEIRGSKLINHYENSWTKITVECKNGHRRELLVSSLYKKPGCLMCSKEGVYATNEEKLIIKEKLEELKIRTSERRKETAELRKNLWRGKFARY